ncbi:MAG: hypothetical protein A2017_15060 [Lentisphaerae bacterium GWF2_44_16]|nr:MAG: hypothetical protein A2017_15060 [Lentisphaerae bacterium GWF2_44_16]
MKNTIIAIMIILSSSLFAEEIKIMQAMKTGNAPVIDGVLSESCWQSSSKAREFSLIISGTGLARMQTSFAVLYDETNLYLGIECKEENMSKLKKTCNVHDGPVYADDCIEIFFDTNLDQQTYFHLIVNAAGTKADWDFKNKEWNPRWETAVKESKKSWTLEIAIPFSELGINKVTGSLLRFNVCRARMADETEYSCWSNTNGSFHAPTKFGWLTIGTYDETVKYNLIPEIKKIIMNYNKRLSGKGEIEKAMQKKMEALCVPLTAIEKNYADGKLATAGDIEKLQYTLTRLKNFEYELKLNLLFNEKRAK